MPKPALALAARATRVPAFVAGAGDRAAVHFLEFFTVNIRNKKYARGLCHLGRFLANSTTLAAIAI
jgi:hypothetical protein